ncbi:hypothetical protein B0H16DRAFT_1536795 [Mycena metata]|uniref:Uncharacterized protein n=1 Tax=Mycena metata TaxID=1033252 RepID=A0AAD7NEM5_9AGAR|nr:hypothetical protein B0H16DRAFT_1536795 [Mycena metata]
MEPIEAYLSRYGSTLTTLSLSILVDDSQCLLCLNDTATFFTHLIWNLTDTQDFEMRTLKLALRWQLRDLSLVHQRPKTVPTTLMLLSSVPLLRLEIGVVPIGAFGPPDWTHIDEIVASRFKGLQRLSFLHSWMRTPLTPEISALMPQAVARQILAHEYVTHPQRISLAQV